VFLIPYETVRINLAFREKVVSIRRVFDTCSGIPQVSGQADCTCMC
jgi:hypothetical protein